MKKKQLAIVAVVALAISGAGYKTVLAKPKAKAEKPNVEGTIYVLQKEFLVNLAGDRYAKISAALLLSHDDTSTAGGGGHGAPVPPEGYGPMTQEAVVRDIITDALTGHDAAELEDSRKRDKLREEIVGRIHKETDVKAEEILFPDLTVQ
jgi:flagellar basal body-associated protein FliL